MISWHEHDDWIACRVTIADPGQHPVHATSAKNVLAFVCQIPDQIINGACSFIVLPERKDWC